MSFSERTVWAELLASLTIVALVVWYIATRHATGAFDGPEGLQLWARTVLVLIAASIVVAILVSILFAIGYRIVTGEDPDDLVDERDRQIAGLGWKVSMIATGAGFVAALVALAAGLSAFGALNAMLASCALGDLSGNIAKLIRYRQVR